jgi:hypothetical protein
MKEILRRLRRAASFVVLIGSSGLVLVLACLWIADRSDPRYSFHLSEDGHLFAGGQSALGQLSLVYIRVKAPGAFDRPLHTPDSSVDGFPLMYRSGQSQRLVWVPLVGIHSNRPGAGEPFSSDGPRFVQPFGIGAFSFSNGPALMTRNSRELERAEVMWIQLTAPNWLLMLACGLYPLLRLLVIIRKRRRASLKTGHQCKACGYDLRATPQQCPECGTKTEQASSGRQGDLAVVL